MMIRILTFGLALLLTTQNSFAITIEDVNLALKDIYEHLHSHDESKGVDEQRLQKNIDTLELATQEMEFDAPNYKKLLTAQLEAATAINNKLRFAELPYDVSQVQKLLDNLDILKQTTDIYLGDLEFTAGHIAAHQLNNQSLAHRYWSNCGRQKHAGCMNILATSYETGQFSEAVDLDKAVYWHSQVVATGTRWSCAGTYSARRLAILNETGVDTEKPTSHWLQSATKLREEFAQKMQRSEVCGSESEYILRYTLESLNSDWLEKLQHITLDESDVTNSGRSQWIAEFAQAKDLQSLRPSLEAMYDDYFRCESAEQLTLKFKDDPTKLQVILDYVNTLDPEQCATVKATIYRLQNLSTL